MCLYLEACERLFQLILCVDTSSRGQTLERICLHCGRELPANLARQARYCCRSHSTLASRKRLADQAAGESPAGPRICLYCGDELPAYLSANARYCSRSHSALASSARIGDRAERDRYAEQEKYLSGYAPADAVSYRLGIRRTDAGPLHFFPKGRAGFQLAPFDLPAVPVAGLYVVRYFDRLGEPLDIPRELIGGLWIPADPKVRF